jgi:hypothetical protein
MKIENFVNKVLFYEIMNFLHAKIFGPRSTEWQIKSPETITAWLKTFGGFSSENT